MSIMKSGLTTLACWPTARNTYAAYSRQEASGDCSLAVAIARTFEWVIAFGTFRPSMWTAKGHGIGAIHRHGRQNLLWPD